MKTTELPARVRVEIDEEGIPLFARGPRHGVRHRSFLGVLGALILTATVLAVCSVQGRSVDELRRTPFGNVEPEAAQRFGENYTAGSWHYGSVPECPWLTRVFITSDVGATTASLTATAERVHVHPDENGDFAVRAFAVAGTTVEWWGSPVPSDDNWLRAMPKHETLGMYLVTLIVRDRSRSAPREPGRCGLPADFD